MEPNKRGFDSQTPQTSFPKQRACLCIKIHSQTNTFWNRPRIKDKGSFYDHYLQDTINPQDGQIQAPMASKDDRSGQNSISRLDLSKQNLIQDTINPQECRIQAPMASKDDRSGQNSISRLDLSEQNFIQDTINPHDGQIQAPMASKDDLSGQNLISRLDLSKQNLIQVTISPQDERTHRNITLGNPTTSPAKKFLHRRSNSVYTRTSIHHHQNDVLPGIRE